jgi:hypothetical protein
MLPRVAWGENANGSRPQTLPELRWVPGRPLAASIAAPPSGLPAIVWGLRPAVGGQQHNAQQVASQVVSELPMIAWGPRPAVGGQQHNAQQVASQVVSELPVLAARNMGRSQAPKAKATGKHSKSQGPCARAKVKVKPAVGGRSHDEDIMKYRIRVKQAPRPALPRPIFWRRNASADLREIAARFGEDLADVQLKQIQSHWLDFIAPWNC